MRIGALAERVGARVLGDATIEIATVRSLEAAGPGDLSVLHAASSRAAAEASRAAALLVPSALVDAQADARHDTRGEGLAEALGRPLLIADDSRLTLARILEALGARGRPAAGVHPTAVLGDAVRLGEDVHIGPYAVLGDRVDLGDQAVIGAHAVVGDDCRLGAEARLHPHVVLYDGTVLGDRVEVHAGTVVGADGFGYATTPRGVHHKVPQVGRAVLEDDVEVGALTAIDRATLEETRIGAGTKIDNLVQVGHNVRAGRGCILCGQSGVAGSTTLGDHVVLAGQVGVSGHLAIGDRVQAAAASVLLRDVESGRQVAGSPAVDLPAWRRQTVVLGQLPALAGRLRRLERRLDAIEHGAGGGVSEVDDDREE